MMAKAEEYTVKNIKTFVGHDGQGFNLSLYHNGEKVAFVIDLAYGGDFDYQWVDWKEPKVDINITNYKKEPVCFKGTPEEKLIYELVETLPLEKSDTFPDGIKETVDGFVASILEKLESEQWNRKLKKYFLFQIANEIGTDSYRTFKKENITRREVEKYIAEKFPDKKYKLLD